VVTEVSLLEEVLKSNVDHTYVMLIQYLNITLHKRWHYTNWRTSKEHCWTKAVQPISEAYVPYII